MASGIMNISGDGASGVHLAGLANITGATFNGVTAGGLLNVIGEHLKVYKYPGLPT